MTSRVSSSYWPHAWRVFWTAFSARVVTVMMSPMPYPKDILVWDSEVRYEER